MKKVLVTGGAGFIGAYVCRQLARAGAQVVVHDLSPLGNVLDALSWSDTPKDCIRVTGALTDFDGLVTAIQLHKIDSVVHLGSPLIDEVEKDPRIGLDQIVRGTCNVFDAALACGVRRAVWASSLSVFGRHNGDCLAPIPFADPSSYFPLWGGEIPL